MVNEFDFGNENETTTTANNKRKQYCNIIGCHKIPSDVKQLFVVKEDDDPKYTDQSFWIETEKVADQITEKICNYKDQNGNKSKVTYKQIDGWATENERYGKKYPPVLLSRINDKGKREIPIGQAKKCTDVILQFIEDVRSGKRKLNESGHGNGNKKILSRIGDLENKISCIMDMLERLCDK